MGNRVMYGFEVLVHDLRFASEHDPHECTGRCRWSSEAAGHQGPDNYFSSESDALAELPNLARCLSEPNYPVSVSDLRVVAVSVQS